MHQFLTFKEGFYLVVGLNLQEKRRDHTDSFLSADVTLQGQTKKMSLYFSEDL